MITQRTVERRGTAYLRAERYFINNSDRALAISTKHKIEHLVWNYVEFAIIGYERNLQTDAALDIIIFAVKKSDIPLEGELTMQQILECGHVSALKQIPEGIKGDLQV